MPKIFFRFILIIVILLLAVLLVWAWWKMRTAEPLVTPVEQVELEETSDSDVSQTESLFEIDPGVRAMFASNPLVLAQTEDTLTLAYESRSDELKNAPGERARVMSTQEGGAVEYGLLFEEEDADAWDVAPEPIQLPSGIYRRYFYRPEAGGVQSESSLDGESFTLDDGVRYHIGEVAKKNNPDVFGVSTYFVDVQGGVVLLYNSTIDNEIVVNRAYAAPGTNGLDFEFDRADILADTLEEPHYADPHTLVRENGDIWLVVMNQSRTKHPPLSREGIIYGYVSRDDGETFELEGRLVGWDDFEEFDVYSLNDPKLVEFPDGTLRVYIAALIKDDSMEEGFRWDLVSAHD